MIEATRRVLLDRIADAKTALAAVLHESELRIRQARDAARVAFLRGADFWEMPPEALGSRLDADYRRQLHVCDTAWEWAYDGDASQTELEGLWAETAQMAIDGRATLARQHGYTYCRAGGRI